MSIEETRVPLKKAGSVRIRSFREITSSCWTLGCETLDRDFADYEQYKEYLPTLGFKSIRLQAGWAKCERQAGIYRFEWLDSIIDDARAKGLDILLETDYGNPVYPGGGGFDLAAGFPDSPEALLAWDRWIDAISRHFCGRVREWAMWNEPDLNAKHTPEDIAAFNMRTAEIIKQNIPAARISGLSLASIDPFFFERCLQAFQKAGKLDLFDFFIYHGYRHNPDFSYSGVEELKAVLRKYSDRIRMRQGENGCPSEEARCFALGGYPWTERSQAKWDLRRCLGDLGHDVKSSLFTICDFNHIGREINRKGLLLADAEHHVLREKQVCAAVRCMTSVFAEEFRRVSGRIAVLDERVAAYTYENPHTRLAVLWRADAIPGESTDTENADVILKQFPLRQCVLADLRTGIVYDFPADRAETRGDCTLLRDVPLYDSPMVLGEKSYLI